MIKKAIRLLALILTALLPLGAAAQTLTGSWSLLPSFGTTYSQIIETPQRTFVLAGGFLMSMTLDADSQVSETYYYNVTNKLSDNGINQIRYNFDKGYLMIAYTNGNIDLLYDDDHVVNMPELKDASLTTSHTIGQIDFGADRIVATTDFGIVIFNDERHEVVEAGMYGKKVDFAMIMGENLLIAVDNKLLWSPLNKRHPRLESFDTVKRPNGADQGIWPTSHPMARINDHQYVRIAVGNGNSSMLADFDPETGILTETVLRANVSSAKLPVNYADGKVFFTNNWLAYQVNADGTDELFYVLPQNTAQRGTSTFITTDKTSAWIAYNNNGFARYDLTEPAGTLLMDKYKPAAISVTRPFFLTWNNDNTKMYISSNARSAGMGDDGTLFHVAAYGNESGVVTDITPSLALGNAMRLTPDPDDPDIYYVGSGYHGFRVIRNDEPIHQFTIDNTPFPQLNNLEYVVGIDFDPEGNMWVSSYTYDQNCLIVLPAAKIKNAVATGDWSSIGKSDWLIPELPSSSAVFYDTHVTFVKNRPYALYTSGASESGVMTINHNNTLTDFSDDRIYHTQKLTDQGGSSNIVSGVYSITQDHDGKVWIGSNQGVFVMSDPAAAMNPNYMLTRPLVARNDGTNYGDYLLATECISSIAVDHSNCKWLATAASGVYRVSPDGSEILEHFNKDNSPLVSNTIYGVSVNPNNNEVFFATDAGVYVYNSSSSPAADDYSDVLVYPNPVRPEYTGMVTITGLMDNSLVKIADSVGNVVYTGTSEGGSMTWDVCNSNGSRVRSGIYFIMASQNAEGNTGVVAKVMVIN